MANQYTERITEETPPQEFMDLPSKTASQISGTDYMMLVNNSEAYKALVNDVAEAILSKLTSKSFSGLETTAKNVIGALNELNSKSNNKEIVSAGLVPEKCTIIEGGYTEIGSIVVVNIRLEIPNKVNPNDTFTITGFPIPKKESGKNQNNIPCSINIPRFNAYMTSSGVLTFLSLQELSAPLNVLVGAVYVKA